MAVIPPSTPSMMSVMPSVTPPVARPQQPLMVDSVSFAVGLIIVGGVLLALILVLVILVVAIM